MLLLKLILTVAAVVAAPIAYLAATLVSPQTTEPEMIALQAGQVIYPPAGDFMRSGKPVNAPLKTVYFARGLRIMKHQVTQAEYLKCVEDRGCPAAVLPGPASADAPMVGVSWRDATDYATWYSDKAGQRYRL